MPSRFIYSQMNLGVLCFILIIGPTLIGGDLLCNISGSMKIYTLVYLVSKQQPVKMLNQLRYLAYVTITLSEFYDKY